jgi:hypothetical protein
MGLISSYQDRPLDGFARRLHDHTALRTALNQIVGQLIAFGIGFTIYCACVGETAWLAFTIPLGSLGFVGNERSREDDARFHARLRNIR